MNNNLVNVNNTWTGSTHLDNNIGLSNVLVKNIINTSNYILNTSNDLVESIKNTSNYIYNTSNDLVENIKYTSNYVLLSSNQISNEFKNLIYNFQDGTGIFNSALNTNIYASSTLGEIRFITKGTPSYFGNNYKFITKIQENGRLAVH
jgi:hypothetical protein